MKKEAKGKKLAKNMIKIDDFYFVFNYIKKSKVTKENV